MMGWRRTALDTRGHLLWAVLAALALVAGGISSAPDGVYAATTPNSISLADDGEGGPVGAYSSLALDANGYPVVSYWDSSANDLRILHCNDPNCSGQDESITVPDTNGGTHTSLALDASGFPVVAYNSASVGGLAILHCNDPNCEGGDESIALGAPGGRQWMSIELDASGYPVVSASSGFALQVLRCNDADCAGGDESLVNVDASPGNVGQYSSLELDASGFPVISYYYHNGTLAGGELRVLHCNDLYCSGGDESIAAPDPWPYNHGGYASLALDASGFPVVSYRGSSGLAVLHCNDANCMGGDESITNPHPMTTVKGGPGHSTSIELDALGFPVVSYVDVGVTEFKLTVLHCNDVDCAGGDDSIAVAGAAVFSEAPTSLVLDTSDRPVVSYQGEIEQPGPDALALHLLRCNDADCAGGDESAATPDTVGAGGLGGFLPSVALDASGNPVISHTQLASEARRIVHCGDPSCTGPVSATSPDIGLVPREGSLELDAAGNPVVAYSGSGIQVMHCDDPNCVDGSENIEPLATSGTGASLELDANGLPVLSYASPAGLTIIHCNEPLCTGTDESIVHVDPAGGTGGQTSLALDASGFPVVSYGASGGLKVLHCNDANCEGGDESITTPDAAGDVSQYNSLALDASGFPVVSYSDSANQALKLLHCNDAECAGVDESITSPVTPIGGQQLSLVLDGLGFPVVSFRGESGLYVLHCNDPDCSGGNDSVSPPLDPDQFSGDYSSLALDASGLPVVVYQKSFQLWVLHCGNMYCDTDDSDLDGCTDSQEAAGSEVNGGQRGAKNFWDFFDVPTGVAVRDRDGSVSGLDFFAVLSRFGTNGSATSVEDALAEPTDANSYHAAYDRAEPSGDPWDLVAADGSISGSDLFAMLGQFGHSCA
jgi:hypothetical protein